MNKVHIQTRRNYKDVRVHSLARTSPAEVFNAVTSITNGITSLSSFCNSEGCSTLTGEAVIGRIPVEKRGNSISEDGVSSMLLSTSIRIEEVGTQFISPL